jgi:hypothetical protein
MDSVTMGGLVNGLKGLFQDSSQIKEQYREGMIGRTAMADWYENDRMWTLTNGSDVACTMAAAAAVTDGGNVMTMASLSAAPATWRGVHRSRCLSVPPGDEGFAGQPAAVHHHRRHDRDPDGLAADLPDRSEAERLLRSGRG